MTPPEKVIAQGILFTHQYQLTMAQLYFRFGVDEQTLQFEHFFRTYPNYGTHKAGFCVNAGLEWLLTWMAEARFTNADLAALASQRGPAGQPVFADDFLGWLREHGNFGDLTIHAIPEGRA